MSSKKRGNRFRNASLICLLGLISLVATVEVASAQGAPAPAECAGPGECLCDNAYQDCRTPLLDLIKAETQGIAVSMWFMTDHRYSTELAKKKVQGVDVRVILDLQADKNYPANKTERERLLAAGIPARDCISTKGINHWKAMIFKGKGKVQFSAANFANGSFSPTVTPYVTYVDEAIYFTDDPAVVKTFMRRFDEHWLNTTEFQSLGSFPLIPMFEGSDQFPLDPDMNFVPYQYYEDRLRPQVALEDPLKNPAAAIDAVMFRITSGKIPDALIARRSAGVPIRIVTDRGQYRNTTYFWHSYNIDRMYAQGRRSDGSCEFPPCIEVKWKNTSLTDQDMHQKSIILHTRGAATKAPMVVFGSANWTSSSNNGQREHNYFSRKTWMVDWFIDQFNRKWNNLKADGSPIGQNAFVDYVPGFPETPVYSSPANDALGQSTTVTLKWEGGWWAHKYDILLSQSPASSSGVLIAPPIVSDFMPGSATAGVKTTKESYILSGLQPGTVYYWQVRGKTMANKTKIGPIWRFTTAGGVPAPPAPSGLTATAVSNSRIDLAWTDVAGEDGYKIERKLTSSSTWTQVAQTSADVVSYADTSGLSPGTGYNYRVRSFTSGGNSGYSNTATATTPMVTLSVGDVVLYAWKAQCWPLTCDDPASKWKVESDSTAAGGARISNANLGAATVTTPVAQPAEYFEMQFTADANTPYRLWMRGKATANNGYNDSVWVQFADAVNAKGDQINIGTTTAEWVNLQDCSGAAMNGWGWQDNGYAASPCGFLGPLITFTTSGVQTIRVQVREDGASFDQIVLSPDTYLNVSPGATKADTVKLPEQGGN